MYLKTLELFHINDENHNKRRQLFYALFFTIFTVLALGIDSVSFIKNYFDGRNITNILAILYFLLFFYVSDIALKKLMILMVFLSYIGEIIFCTILGMYHYRTDIIPLYVPFGHAIVYASGYVFAHTNWAIKNEKKITRFFILFFIALFSVVGYFFYDLFSILFGALFFVILKRKKWQNLYCFIALCVIFIELVGTYFKCWAWEPKSFNIISTANPPMGAVFFYAGGDVLLVKIVSYLDKIKKM